MGNGKLHSDAVLVVGLGRFGAAAAEALHRLGHEVLAVERNPELVQEWSGRLTHVVEADSTNLQAMKQIGAGQFPIAVVGIGTSIEASVLSTLNLVDLKVGQSGPRPSRTRTARSSSGWPPRRRPSTSPATPTWPRSPAAAARRASARRR